MPLKFWTKVSGKKASASFLVWLNSLPLPLDHMKDFESLIGILAILCSDYKEFFYCSENFLFSQVGLIESLLQLSTRIRFLIIENSGLNIRVLSFLNFFKGLGGLTTPLNKPTAIVFILVHHRTFWPLYPKK